MGSLLNEFLENRGLKRSAEGGRGGGDAGLPPSRVAVKSPTLVPAAGLTGSVLFLANLVRTRSAEGGRADVEASALYSNSLLFLGNLG